MRLDKLCLNFCVPTSEFKRLFDISDRTYQRWNKNPPEHVFELFRKAMDGNPFIPDCWAGWRFEENYLVDPDGNSYELNEVRAIFWNRQLIKELTGTKDTVRSMKQHLDKKTKAISAPTLSVSLQSGGEEIRHWELNVSA